MEVTSITAPHPQNSNNQATKTPYLQPHINPLNQVIFSSHRPPTLLYSNLTMETKSEPSSSNSFLRSASSPPPMMFSRFRRASLQWTGFTSVQSFVLFVGTVGVFALFSMSQATWMRPQAPGGKFWFERTWWLGWGLRWHAWVMIRMSLLLSIPI